MKGATRFALAFVASGLLGVVVYSSVAASREVDQLERTRSELLVEASRREAARARQEAERLRADFPEFAEDERPLLFTGEMIYPWMFEEIAGLRPFKAGVDTLARHRQHSALYDTARLAKNDIPLSAVIYHDDMFVDAELSLETAGRVGNMDFWITNEFEHDGIRQSGAVFRRLVDLVRDKGGPRATA